MNFFRRKTREEIRDLSEDEFIDYMEAWDLASAEKWKNTPVIENDKLKFDSVEAIKEYYGAITFEEFEQKLMDQFGNK